MRAILSPVLIIVIICIITSSIATYRKPPFNGSIFGKRGNNEDNAEEKSLWALCEIASQTCQAWYQALENKK